jgi:hypothetical protein
MPLFKIVCVNTATIEAKKVRHVIEGLILSTSHIQSMRQSLIRLWHDKHIGWAVNTEWTPRGTSKMMRPLPWKTKRHPRGRQRPQPHRTPCLRNPQKTQGQSESRHDDTGGEQHTTQVAHVAAQTESKTSSAVPMAMKSRRSRSLRNRLMKSNSKLSVLL